MANEIGFSLEIPDGLLKDLETVDKAIENIAITAKDTATKFNTQIDAMSKGNISNLLAQLNQVKGALDGIGSTNVATSGLGAIGASFDSASQDATQFITQIASIADSLNKLYSSQSSTSNQKSQLINLEELDIANADVKTLTERIKTMQRLLGKEENKFVDETQEKNIANITRELNKATSQYSKLTAQAKLYATYEKAMSASEGTLSQRTNKLIKFTEVQKKLNLESDKYAAELKEIEVATKRIEDANNRSVVATDNMRKSQSRLLNITGQLARQAALYFSISQVQGYIQKLAEVRGEFELQQKSLQAIMQDKYQADKVWAQIVDLSVRSPFRLKELTSYTKQLAAYRVENEKIFDTTKMLADVSAGLGVDMSRLILAYGQVKAANYLRGTELRQFSEAGINILGELSAYFTELEGRAISTADVFEIVSKRMVSFEDVNKIFKNLTESGGIFYNMQEIQAETLAGKISNLNDAYDIMFDKIGRNNEGILKGSIDAVRAIVENYEYVVIAVEAIVAGLGVYGIQIARATLLNKGFAASQIQATIASGGMAAGLAKVVNVVKAMTAAMVKNPITLAAVAISAAIGLIVKRLGDMEESSKFYDTLTNQLQDTRNSFDSLSDKINNNNREINNYKKNLESLDKSSEEYAKTQSSLNSAISRQELLMKQLQNEFPDVANGLKIQKDGTIDLTKAITDLNTQLNLTSTLNYLAKQSGSFWTDDVKNNIMDATESFIDYKMAIGDVNSAYNIFRGDINEKLLNNSDLEKAYGEQLRGILDSGLQPMQQLEAVTDLINKQYNRLKGGAYSLTNEERQGYTILLSLQKQYFDAVSKAQKAQSNYTKDASTLSSQFATIVDSFAKTIDVNLPVETIKKQVEAFIDSFGIQEQAVRDLIGTEFETKLNIDLDFSKDKVKDNYSKLQKEIKAYIEKNDLGIISIKIKEGDSVDKYFEDLRDKVKEIDYELEGLDTPTQNKQLDGTNAERIKELELERKAVVKLLTDYDELREKEKGSSKTGKTNEEKTLEAQTALLKKLNSEYEKLRKYSDVGESFAETIKFFNDAISSLDLSSLITAQGGLTDADTYAIFKVLLDKAKQVGSNVGADVIQGLLESMGGSGVQINIDAKVSNLESIAQGIETMFDQYDLTIDLQGLGFTADQSKELFNFDFTSLDELRNKITENRNALFALGTDGEKEYQDAMGKITDMEIKAQKERNKRVYEILRQSYTEREQLEIDYQKNLEDIRKSEFDDVAKNKATANVTAQYQLDVAELDYKDFKLTDEYVKAFEDLDNFGEATINHLLRVFEDFSKTANLSPETLKVLMDKIQELQNAAIAANPFETLKNSIKDYTAAIKEAKTAQSNLKIAEQEESVAKQEQQKAELEFEGTSTSDVYEYEAAYASLVKANEKLADATEKVDEATKEAAKADDKRIKALNEAQDAVNETEEGFGSFADVINSSIDLIKDFAEGLGIALDPETEAVLDGIQKGLAVVAAIFPIITAAVIATDVAAKSLMTTLFPLLLIGAALGAIFAIIGAADAAREEVIENETRKVEQLEKAYERLQETFEKSMNIDKLEATTAAMLSNIEEQIDALEKARAAELDKKQSDQDAIDDFNEQISEKTQEALDAQNELTRELGGIGSDEWKTAAQDFLESWEEAFLETGDGLSALEDKFDETVQNMIRSAAMSKIVDALLSPLLDQIDLAAQGGLTPTELAELTAQAEELFPQLNEALKSFYEAYGQGASSAAGELSALQQGIQSATEPTMAAVEAYLNSIRFEVYRQGEVMNAMLLAMQSVGALNNAENSIIYKELVTQTAVMRSIDARLDSVIKQGGANGAYIQTNL